MKKILFFLILCFTACQKETEAEADDYEIVSDENDLTAELSEASELDERTSTAVKIDSMVDISEFAQFKKVPNNSCNKFAGYQILPENETVRMKISGKNFGATQGSSTVTVYITGKTYSSTKYTVLSWSDTQIVVNCDSLPLVKNVVFKITLGIGGKSKPKSIKCVGANGSYGGTATATNRTYIAYPSSLYEVTNLLRDFGKDLEDLNEPQAITGTYKPRLFDVVRRANQGSEPKTWDYQYGVITAVSAADKDGFVKCKVQERNRLCTARIEKAAWKYKNGQITRVGAGEFSEVMRF